MAKDRAIYEEALNRGHALSWDQRWQEAVAAFRKARDVLPQEPAPYAGMGMAFLELDQLDDALEAYKQAARLAQGDVIYLRQVADAQVRLGQKVDAGATCMAIGEALIKQQKLGEALENWNRAVQLDPDLLAAHQRLVAVYQRQGNVRAAIRSYIAIARIFQRRGDAERAVQTCQAALKLDPRNPDILTAIEKITAGEPLRSVSGDAGLLTGTAGSTNAGREGGAGAEGSDEEGVSPVQEARRMAMEQLAEELFADTSLLDTAALEVGPARAERDALISRALDFQTRGLLDEAIRTYEEAVTAGVDSPAVYFNLGLLYQDRLRFEDAISHFERAVREPEYRIASHFSLGECHRARGRIDKAAEHFITVLKIVDLATVQHEQADRLIELYQNLSDSLLSKGQTEQATAFANALVDFLSHKGWEDKVKKARVQLDALSGDRTMILGDILTAGSEQILESLYLSQEYARRGLFASAIEESYQVVRLSPFFLPAHWQLAEMLVKQERLEAASQKFITIGDAYRARGDVTGALNAFERVAEINPLDVSIRARLVDLLKRHGQIDRALEHYLAMGNAYYQLAQVEKARETYQEALKLAPRGSAERNWRAQFLRALADIDMERLDWRGALVAYRELRDVEPDDERIAMTLINLHYRLGQSAHAIKELDRYLIQLVKSKRGAKLTGILEDMLAQHPTDPGLVDRLARLYWQQKKYDAAIELLDKLGEAQLISGDRRAAHATIQKIVKLNPPNVSMYQQLLNQLSDQQ